MAQKRAMSRCVILVWCVACAPDTSISNLALQDSGSDGEASQAALSRRSSKKTHFAIIGDYGIDSEGESDVADLVHEMQPDFIITTGDNNYPEGEAHTLDVNVGKYYNDYIFPYHGVFASRQKSGSAVSLANRFWPALGNHDWEAGELTSYLKYFTLPGNGRYYDFVAGPVHFFALDTDPREPDGVTSDSVQGRWLKQGLASSRAPWKIVYMHHPPFASAKKVMRKEVDWPYARWGASMVVSGHKHFYERLEHDGIPYVVNGLGGADIAKFGKTHSESLVRYNDDFGAMRAEVGEKKLHFEFITRNAEVIDEFSLRR